MVLLIDISYPRFSSRFDQNDYDEFLCALESLRTGKRNASLINLDYLTRYCNALRAKSSSFAMLEDEEQLIYSFLENIRQSVKIIIIEDRQEFISDKKTLLSLIARDYFDFLKTFSFYNFQLNTTVKLKNCFQIPLKVEGQLTRGYNLISEITRRIQKLPRYEFLSKIKRNIEF